MTTQYHKTLGQVTVNSQDDKITIITVVATGEVKKLDTYILKSSNILQDTPFVTAPKVKKTYKKVVVRENTPEEQARINYLHATGQGLDSILKRSRNNLLNNRAGASKM